MSWAFNLLYPKRLSKKKLLEQKAIKIICSCSTLEQLSIAKSWLVLAIANRGMRMTFDIALNLHEQAFDLRRRSIFTEK